MSGLTVEIRHRFPGFALDVAFASPAAGTTVLFGPSGSGKSSVVAAIAGLMRPDAGRIALGETVLFDAAAGLCVPTRRRALGVVFQDARLFPHMSVATNLRYGARRARSRAIGFDEVVDLLGLSHLLARRPRDLSGGERQRVAIGRALLAQPRLLLMDEPLAALDAGRKREILPFLARLKAALALPIVYVTHSLDEVARLADELVLMERGAVLASGPLGVLAARGDLPLARRDDAAAVLEMRVARHDRARGLSLLEAAGLEAAGPEAGGLEAEGLRLWVPLVAAAPGQPLRASIPAREVILANAVPDAVSVHNVIACTVRAVAGDPARHAAIVELAAGPQALLARVTPDAVERLALRPGRPVFALVKSMSVDVLGG